MGTFQNKVVDILIKNFVTQFVLLHLTAHSIRPGLQCLRKYKYVITVEKWCYPKTLASKYTFCARTLTSNVLKNLSKTYAFKTLFKQYRMTSQRLKGNLEPRILSRKIEKRNLRWV